MIGRLLRHLVAAADDGEIEIVVVCNGCTDDTAEVARQVSPAVIVLETSVASKTDALNAGDAVATGFPRFYVDADVELDVDSVRLVARNLGDVGPLCAAPTPQFVVAGRPWLVRQFYRAWEQLPFLQDSMIGSGVYALNEEGRRRFGRFPGLIADDQFVMQQFSAGERIAVEGATFRVQTPMRIGGLVRIRTRVYRGNRQLVTVATPEGPTGHRFRGMFGLARRPSYLPALASYVALNLLATIRARRTPEDAPWERDDSARRPSSHLRPASHRVGYLVSRYPAPSHTFVLREVFGARAAGLDVLTFSVQKARAEDLLSRDDRREAARTWAIRPISPVVAALIHARALLRHPTCWLWTLRFALRQAQPGLRNHVWQALYFGEAIILADECKRQGVRHLHAHLANVAADVAWLASAWGCRVSGPGTWAWTFSMHGPTEFSDVQGFNLVRKAAAASLVLCISDFARSQLMAILPADEWPKLAVVHMGVDLDRYHPTAVSLSAGRAPEILSVGRLDPVKGHAVLLDAVSRLVEQGVRLHVTLVGAGPGETAIRSQRAALGLEGVVTLAGALGQDDLPALYRDADVFCLPSFSEGVPVVLMEAMASGIPVVSTTIAGIPELVASPEMGMLVAPGRADLLAEALDKLLRDPELREAMGAAGRERVRAGFDSLRCGAEAAKLLAGVKLAVR